MNCAEFKQIFEKYLQGRVSSEEEQAIEAHLQTCTDCQRILDEGFINAPTLRDGKLPQPDTYLLDEKKQARILRLAKYKNRFSLAIFLFSLFIVLYMASMLLSSYYFNSGGENSRLYKVQKTALALIEFTFPNVSVQPELPSPFPPWYFSSLAWGQNRLDIKPGFRAEGTYFLQKQVGKENRAVGTLNTRQFFNIINPEWNWQNGSFQDYLCFYYPGSAPEETAQSINETDRASQEVWKALTQLPEGTVAEMAVSLDKTYSIDEIRSIFADYDLDICWYAVYTGLEEYGEYSGGGGDPLSAFAGVWGFSGYDHYNYCDQEKYFLDSMQFLAENKETAAKLYRGGSSSLRLDERVDYLKTHGVRIYGVVLTGPSKELLKLKELPAIRHPALGDVALWNWLDRNFSGQMY